LLNFTGPFLGMMLADFGAEVIRIERDLTSSDIICNRGKKSFACDLKNPQAKKIVENLIKTAGSKMN
jgi:alpha-methylacyl-CoA racemase